MSTTVYSSPLYATAPVASAPEAEKTASSGFSISLAGSVPEMYRMTLAAMIDGQKVSTLIPLPYICCGSKPAVALDTHTEISQTKELEGEDGFDREEQQEGDVENKA